MQFTRLRGAVLAFSCILAMGFTLQTLQQPAYSQETTGGL